jgi:hypothetical protein
MWGISCLTEELLVSQEGMVRVVITFYLLASFFGVPL